MKKIISAVICILLAASLTACGGSKTATSSSKTSSTSSKTSTSTNTATPIEGAPEKPDFVEVGSNGSRTNDEVGFQFEAPAVGEEIAVLHTSEGDIKARLFPDSAPIAVANFKALINAHYYDGIIFHRVIKDFMIQGGDPKGTGTGGQSAWGSGFEVEANDNLRHYIGALSMAHSSLPDSNGSQFFIVQGLSSVPSSMMSQYASKIGEKATQLYSEKGGYVSLDGDYSVFGQVFEGMEVVNEIAGVTTNSSDKPTKDIVIKSAEIVKYEG